MEWDLGLRGVAVLVGMSLAFGVGAQLVMWRATTHRLWAIVSLVVFLTGIFTSEVLFGWATEEDLQPNIDGLSFDEVLMFGFVATAIVMLVAWRLSRHGHTRPPHVTA